MAATQTAGPATKGGLGSDKPTLTKYLESTDKDLRECLLAISTACAKIAVGVKLGNIGTIENVNSFGDQQLEIDVYADKMMFAHLTRSGVVAAAASEEVPTEMKFPGQSYSVAFDPLDGSSVIGTNFSVGTIFGVWPGKTLLNRTGREQVAAGCAVYGPRTTLSIAVDKLKSAEFILGLDGQTWTKTQDLGPIKEGKLFAPGNLRATQTHEGYNKLVNYWITNKYTLRYTGGMVPDVNQLLIKGKGVFCNPSTESAPAKLRLAFETAPLAYLVESSGGKSSDGATSLLDVPITSLDVRTQACYGSAEEVARFDELVGPSKK